MIALSPPIFAIDAIIFDAAAITPLLSAIATPPTRLHRY